MKIKDFRKVNSEIKTLYVFEFFECDREEILVKTTADDAAEKMEIVKRFDDFDISEIAIWDGVLTVTVVIEMTED